MAKIPRRLLDNKRQEQRHFIAIVRTRKTLLVKTLSPERRLLQQTPLVERVQYGGERAVLLLVRLERGDVGETKEEDAAMPPKKRMQQKVGRWV